MTITFLLLKCTTEMRTYNEWFRSSRVISVGQKQKTLSLQQHKTVFLYHLFIQGMETTFCTEITCSFR